MLAFGRTLIYVVEIEIEIFQHLSDTACLSVIIFHIPGCPAMYHFKCILVLAQMWVPNGGTIIIQLLIVQDWSMRFPWALVGHSSGYVGGNPRVLFAFLVMLETWVDHCKSFDIITPMYLALFTSCRACPLMVYIFYKTVFFLEIRMTSHFAALNDIPQRSHQTASESRSFCKACWSDVS